MSIDRIAENTTLADLLEIKSHLETKAHKKDDLDLQGEAANPA